MRRGKILLTSIAIIILINYLNPVIANATVQNDYVNVTAVQQAKSNWCWAAASQMVGRVACPTSLRTQYNVVSALKGTTGNPYPNVSGSIDDICNGSYYVSNSQTLFVSDSVMSFSNIRNKVRQSIPVVGIVLGTNSMHAVVIYGTSYVDTGSISMYLDIIDPETAERLHYYYNGFVNGNYFNNRRYHSSVYAF